MIPNLIRLGIETILKIKCETIIIKDIQILNKKDRFNGGIDEISIKAENIIFNKINISNIYINIKDVNLKFAIFEKNFILDGGIAKIVMRLTKENINKTFLNKNWNSLKTSIESFISMSFQNIEFKNKSIYFLSSNTLSNTKLQYTLEYERNIISLVNNSNQAKLPILDDKNININNLILSESYIEIELSSKLILN